MTDTVSSARRSEIMRNIRGSDTMPELVARRYLHSLGLRFRKHVAKLPGRPDLVFPSRRTVLFVHGCFWHGCTLCIDGRRSVKSNASYWTNKIFANRERDARNIESLRNAGWRVIVAWECEIDDPEKLRALGRRITEIAVVRRGVHANRKR